MSPITDGHALEFYYDISCPFAYIASTKIEALAARTNAQLIYRPVLLGAIYRATSAPQGAAGSASDVFNATKKAVSSRAFQRTIKRHGIEHKEPLRHPQKTTGALRLLYCIDDQAARAKLTRALFRAYWVEGKDVSSKATLINTLYAASIPGAMALIKMVEDGSFEGEEQRRELETATDQAVKRGTPGVPGFYVPDADRLWWGQDRMHFVESALLALNEGRISDDIGSISTRLQSLIPRSSHHDGIPPGQNIKLQFWYDFSSPWAFLGWTQLARLRRQFGSRLEIEMKPFLLGILFREM